MEGVEFHCPSCGIWQNYDFIWAQDKDSLPWFWATLLMSLENISWVCVTPQSDAGCTSWGIYPRHSTSSHDTSNSQTWAATVELGCESLLCARGPCISHVWLEAQVPSGHISKTNRQDLGIIHCCVWSIHFSSTLTPDNSAHWALPMLMELLTFLYYLGWLPELNLILSSCCPINSSLKHFLTPPLQLCSYR